MNWLLLTRQEREEFGASHKANHCKLWETLRSKSLVCWGKFGNFYCLRIGDLEFSKSCITWEQGWGGGGGQEERRAKQPKRLIQIFPSWPVSLQLGRIVCAGRETTGAQLLRTQLLLLISWVTLGCDISAGALEE